MSTHVAAPCSSSRRWPGLIAVVSGKVLAQGALLACNVIVARVAGPVEFGMYAAALSLVLTLDACAGSPLDYMVIRFSALHGGDPERTAQVQALAFRAKLAIAAVLALLAWALGPVLASAILHDPARTPLLWVVAATTTALLLFRSTATFLQAQARFRAFAALDGVSGALRIVAVGTAALFGVSGAGGYLGALALAYAVLVGAVLMVVPQPYLVSRLPAREDRGAILRFLGATTASIMLGTISGRADLLFLTASVAPETLSAYASAVQLASIATLLAGYASLTAQPLLIPALRDGRGLRSLVESVGIGAVLGGSFWLVAYVSGAALPEMLFGRSAGGTLSGELFTILAAGTAIDLICMPVAMTYALQVRPRRAVAVEFVLTIVFLGSAFALVAEQGASEPGVSAALHMAMLATMLRVAKAIIYIGLMASDCARGWRARRVVSVLG